MAARDVSGISLAPPQIGGWASGNTPQDPIPSVGQLGQTASVPFWDAAYPYPSLDPSNANRSPWDVVVLAGYQLPGLSRVEPGTRKKKRVHKKKAMAKDGATLTFVGYDPAEVIIKCRIWTAEQLNALNNLVPILKPPAPGTVQNVSMTTVTQSGGFTVTATSTVQQKVQSQAIAPVDVYHPALSMFGIRAVVIESVSVLYPTSIKGIWEMDIRCIEYVSPSKGSNDSTANGSQDYGAVRTAISANPASLLPPAPSSDAMFTGPVASLGQ